MTDTPKPPRKQRVRSRPKPDSSKWDPEKARRCTRYPQTPEEFEPWLDAQRARIRELVAAGKWGRPKGLPDGWGGKARRQELAQVRYDAAVRAEYIVYQMKQNDIADLDTQHATLAMQAAVEMVIAQKTNEQGKVEYAFADNIRLGALKVILDFSKQKPAARNQVTLQTAEDWLNSLANKD